MSTRYRHIYNLEKFANTKKQSRSMSRLLSQILDAYTQRSRYAEQLDESVTYFCLQARSTTILRTK
jgi:hypothetical protein